MKKTLLTYGLFLAFLSIVLKTTEYWFWVKLNAFDLYGGLIAFLFMAVTLIEPLPIGVLGAFVSVFIF